MRPSSTITTATETSSFQQSASSTRASSTNNTDAEFIRQKMNELELHVKQAASSPPLSEFYDFTTITNQNVEYPFTQLIGRVVLIVNTATKCGFRKQFKSLELLYEKYRDKGFIILGFPCNQFLNQEPRSEDEIREFCSFTYNVTFPLMKKVKVNGKVTDESVEPLYRWLKSEKKGMLGIKSVKWNFEKFLIDRNGQVVKRYSTLKSPYGLEKDVEELLGQE